MAYHTASLNQLYTALDNGSTVIIVKTLVNLYNYDGSYFDTYLYYMYAEQDLNMTNQCCADLIGSMKA